MGTSHELGQNFAQAFDITYTDERGEVQRPWQTSFGASTRLLGATIMVHGDDDGLRLPPRIAPVQVVVLVARAGEGVLEQAGAWSTISRPRVSAPSWTRIPTSRSAAASSTGSCAACPSGSSSGRATSPPARRRSRSRARAREDDARARRPGARAPAILEQSKTNCSARPLTPRPAHQPRHDSPEADRADPRRRSADTVGEYLGCDGEREPLDDGISVRCLSARTASRSTTSDADGVDAIVARCHLDGVDLAGVACCTPTKARRPRSLDARRPLSRPPSPEDPTARRGSRGRGAATAATDLLLRCPTPARATARAATRTLYCRRCRPAPPC